jgi:hypothetical protein
MDKAAKAEVWEAAHRRTIGWLFETGVVTVNGVPKE